MSGLPKGWVDTTLGEICSKPQYGWTTKASKDGRIRYLRTTDISSGKVNWEQVPFCELEPDDVDKFRVSKNDILVSRAGSVGVSFRIDNVPTDAVFASYLIRFTALGCVLPKYLEYFLLSPDYWNSISEFSAGIAVPNVNASKLAELSVPLPPLNEQRRIVAKLEKLLSRVNAAAERLATITRIVKRFRQSVLAAACSGQLTADWRQAELNESSSIAFLEKVCQKRSRLLLQQGKKASRPIELDVTMLGELPREWSWASVEQLSTKVVDGVHKKPNYVDSGVPFLTVRNLTAGSGISFDRTSFVAEKDHLEFIKRANPEKGDVLVTKDGTLGIVRLIQTDRIFSIFVSLAMIKPVIRTFGPYLALVLAAPQIQQSIVKTGTGLQHIHLRDLRAVPIPIPPEPEQHEIVRRVEALFKTADELEARYLKAKAHLDKLTQSILAKAFRGELVPQDPNDEPASVLLERITAERNGSAVVKRRSRK